MKVKFWMVLLMVVSGMLGGFLFTWAQTTLIHHPGSAYFPDVASTSPHNEDIGYLAECGITGGYWDGTYRPAVLLRRDQMASYLSRSAAATYYLTMLSADWNYHGGYYTGYQAYLAGRISYNQYVESYNLLMWATDLAQYEFAQMHWPDDPIGPTLALRERLQPPLTSAASQVR